MLYGPEVAFRAALINSLVASPLVHFRMRAIVWKCLGLDISLRSRISHGVRLTGTRLHLGRQSTINVGAFIENRETVWIGSAVGIGPGAMVLTSTHNYDDPNVRAGVGRHLPVRIEDGAWVGAGAVILPGVTIGRGAVVAAGAVVTRDVERDCIVAGVPAKVIRRL